MKSVKLGAALSYLTIFLNIIFGLLVTPLMLRTMGDSEYGSYQLVGALVGYISVLDFGLGNAVIRYVAKFRAENNFKKEENFLAMCLCIYAVISTCIIIIGTIVYFALPTAFPKANTSELELMGKMLLVLVVNLALSMPFSMFPGIITGREHFTFAKTIAFLRVIVRIIAIVGVLSLGGRAFAVVVADTVCNIVFAVVSAIYAILVLKTKIRLSFFDVPFLKEIFAYSFFVFLAMIIDQLYWKIGQFVIGVVKGTEAVTPFATAMQLVTIFLQLSTAISALFLPRVTQMVLRKASSKEMTDFLIKTGRVQFMMLGVIVVGFITLGNQFVSLWVGSAYSEVYYITLIIIIPLTVPLIQSVGISVLQAMNKHAFRSIVYLIVTILNVALTFFLVDIWGVIGVAVGTSACLIICNIIIINIYYHKVIKINVPRFFMGVFKGILPVIAITCLVCAPFMLINKNSYLIFACEGAALCAIYAAGIWFFGANKWEKSLFDVRKFLR